MKILGCFKVVPDLELLREEDWAADSENQVDTSFVKKIWNCFDESALEMMLKLSDLSEGFHALTELDAFTIGDGNSEPYLKTLYALGFEKAVRMECREDIRFRPELTAGLIAGYVSQQGGQDIIMMGRQSADGDNGKTPLLTAEKLGWPCITEVMEVIPADESHLCVKSRTDEGILTQTIAAPCVLSVGNATNTYLRVPTLKDRMKKGKKPIEVYQAEQFVSPDVFARAPLTEVCSLSPISHQRSGIVVEGETAAVQAEHLYYSYLKERLEKL